MATAATSPMKKMATEATSFMDTLPEEYLFEILRRLPGDKARSAAACVSKGWMMLLSHVRKSEMSYRNSDEERVDLEEWGDKSLERSLEGIQATDIRLAAVSIGTSSGGGLIKLEIKNSHPTHGVSDMGLKAIARGSPHLKVISLCGVPSISDEGLQEIAKECPLIEELDLRDCPSLTKRGLMAIVESSPNLASLSCQNIGDQDLQAIGMGCRLLKKVHLRNCSISDDGVIKFIEASVSLKTLKLEKCDEITLLGIFRVLPSCESKLRSLALVKCNGTKDIGLETSLFVPSLPLRRLSIKKCAGFGNLSLDMVTKLCPDLISIDLNGLPEITDSGILLLVKNYKDGLKDVKLRGCIKLTDKAVSYGLKVLNLRGCANITDASLVEIAVNCIDLSILDVSGCSITDSGISVLSSSGLLFDLEILLISGCSGVTDRSLQSLTELGERLICLTMTDCNSVSISSMDQLKESLKKKGCSIYTE